MWNGSQSSVDSHTHTFRTQEERVLRERKYTVKTTQVWAANRTRKPFKHCEFCGGTYGSLQSQQLECGQPNARGNLSNTEFCGGTGACLNAQSQQLKCVRCGAAEMARVRVHPRGCVCGAEVYAQGELVWPRTPQVRAHSSCCDCKLPYHHHNTPSNSV